MLTALRSRLLPEHQRRTLEELTDDLELSSGDTVGKRSAYWTMLALSAVIASAGVLADSTATVIGAMIIAPLSTPIMGIALAAVKRQRNGSVPFVVGGALVVVATGAAFSLFLPGSYDLLGNSQIASRVSPNLLDLLAALATGLAGAVALARRDVAAVLPGVAIAISLVPPLAVVGVCLGQGAVNLAVGGAVLFVSNLVSLVLAGMFVFAVLGYATEGSGPSRASSRRTYVTITAMFVAVLAFLGLNTTLTYLVSRWDNTVHQQATAWLSGTPGATVDGVDLRATTFTVKVTSNSDLPSTDRLLASLTSTIPSGFEIRVSDKKGQTINVGTTGG